MGNKQAKAAAGAATTAQAAARFKGGIRGSQSNKQPVTDAPPSTDPSKETEAVSSEAPPTEAAQTESQTVEEPKTEVVTTEEPPDTKPEEPRTEAVEEVEECKEEAAQKPAVAMPALALDKIDHDPPSVEEPKDDPDLMAPPVFLTDAMSSLKETEQDVKPKRPSSNEAVLIASPITHDGVSLEAPAPARTPTELPPERDDVSIDEQVSAAGEDVISESKEAPSEDVDLSVPDRVPGHIPEDTASLTSSVARGEDELLKNIMGTSVAFPALTSNESVRGSVAVSDYYVDESMWDISRRAESVEKSIMESILVSIALHPVDAGVSLSFTYEDAEPATKDAPLESSPIVEEIIETAEDTSADVPPPEAVVKGVVASIFGNICDQPFEEREDDDVKVSLDFTEVDGIKVHMVTAAVPGHRVESYPSEVSSKQLSVELNSPFINSIDDALQSVDESAELHDANVVDKTEAGEVIEPVDEVTAVETVAESTVKVEQETEMTVVEPTVEETEQKTEAVPDVKEAEEEQALETVPVVVKVEPEETKEVEVDRVPESIIPEDATAVAVEPGQEEVKKTEPDPEEPGLPKDAEPLEPETVTAKETEPAVEPELPRDTEPAPEEPVAAKEEDTAVTATEVEQVEEPVAEMEVTSDAVQPATESPAKEEIDQTEALVTVDSKSEEVDSVEPEIESKPSLESKPSSEAKKPKKSKSRKKKSKQTSSTGSKTTGSDRPTSLSGSRTSSSKKK